MRRRTMTKRKEEEEIIRGKKEDAKWKKTHASRGRKDGFANEEEVGEKGPRIFLPFILS